MPPAHFLMPTDAERAKMDADRAARLAATQNRVAESAKRQLDREFQAGVSLCLAAVSNLQQFPDGNLLECRMNEASWQSVWGNSRNVRSLEPPPGEQAQFEFCGVKVQFDEFLPTGLVSFRVPGVEPVLVRLYTAHFVPTPPANLENFVPVPGTRNNAARDLGGG